MSGVSSALAFSGPPRLSLPSHPIHTTPHPPRSTLPRPRPGTITHSRTPQDKPAKTTHPATTFTRRSGTAALTGSVLILATTITGGASSLEAQAAQALGLTVTIDDPNTWQSLSTADFASYAAVIFGDPTCSSPADPYITAAELTSYIWGPAITGNVVVIGTDPVFHDPSNPGAGTLISDGIAHAAGDAGHTGAYIDLSCYYDYSGSLPGPESIPILDAVASPGQFTVFSESGCPDAAHVVYTPPAMAGLTDTDLAGWSCSTHEGFATWPSNFSVVAINEQMPPIYTASDGTTGTPYIVVDTANTPPPAPTGPTGTERNGGNNLSELNQCTCSYTHYPIDSFSGEFYHTFNDFSIAGRGLPLGFSRTYNSASASVNGPLGYGWSDSVHMSLRVDTSTGSVTITQENGGTVSFAPDGSGGYAPPSRVLASLVKNGDGTFTLTRKDQTHYTFNAAGRLVSASDRNGYVTAYAYDGSGNLTSITDSAGRHITLTYDGSGHITSAADPLGRGESFTYDGSGNLVSAVDVNGGTTSFTYTSGHLLLSMTDPRGGVITNSYDGSGRVTGQTDPMNRKTTFSYTAPDAYGETTTTITDPLGNVTVDQYLNGLLIAQTQGYGTPQAATWHYTYDPVSLGQSVIEDPNGNTTAQAWDTHGNLSSVTDPLNDITGYTYDSLNDVTSVTDANGIKTTYTYDANGNLLSTSRPLTSTGETQVTTFTYGDSSHPGDLTAMTDPDGATWTYTYDAYGNRASSTDPLGDKTTYTYNADGWKLSVTSPRGNVPGAIASQYTTTYAYDAFGDVTQTTDPMGGVTKNQYDASRNLTQTTDADGNVTRSTYDADNEMTKTTRADGTSLAYAYDGDGNQIGQTDALGHVTIYTFDSLNRVSSMTDPLNRATTYAYDLAGNRTSLTDASGKVTTYTYDAANRLTGILYSDGTTPNVYYYYDADGQQLYMSDGTGTTSYSYDSLNRLTSSTDGIGLTVSYGYDLAGRVTSLGYPSGQTVTRAYDAVGRLTSVTDWLGNTSAFGYDADGNLVRSDYGNSDHGLFTYDRDDRVTQMIYRQVTPAHFPHPGSSLPIATFTYSRDALGQLTSTTPKTVPGQSNETYGYTTLNQLNAVNTATTANNAAYAYDAAGNLVKRGAQTLAYDSAGELTNLVSASAGTTSYTYDSLGNRTASASGGAAVASYGYDQQNRLVSYTQPATSSTPIATYTYNGDGLRMSKTLSGAATEYFTWDTAEGLPLLLQDAAVSFVYGPGGLPLEQINDVDNTVSFLLQDQLGSTRVVANHSGLVAATYTYDAYGAVTSHTGNASTPLQFAGQYTDAESGLLYLRARYYDPATAQFLTRDPLLALTKAPYGYVSGNPLNGADPTGNLFGLDTLIGAGVGAVLGFGASVLTQEVLTGNVDWNQAAGAAVGGAVTGAAATVCGPFCAGAAGDLASQLYMSATTGSSIDLRHVLISGAVGWIPLPFSDFEEESHLAEYGDEFIGDVASPDNVYALLGTLVGNSTDMSVEGSVTVDTFGAHGWSVC